MTIAQILNDLRTLSNEKVKAHNIKYGAHPDRQFGVKLGDIRKVAKKIKADNQFAIELWNSGYAEAQLVAILLFKNKELSIEQLDKLVNSIAFSHVADWFNSYTLKDHPAREEARQLWMQSDNKWALRSAWSLTAGKIAKESSGEELDRLLDQLEIEMPLASEEVQWTMNTTLAYVGIHHPTHRQRALEIGNKLGIYKDYPVSKGCTSPFAPIWIEEMVSRQKS